MEQSNSRYQRISLERENCKAIYINFCQYKQAHFLVKGNSISRIKVLLHNPQACYRLFINSNKCRRVCDLMKWRFIYGELRDVFTSRYLNALSRYFPSSEHTPRLRFVLLQHTAHALELLVRFLCIQCHRHNFFPLQGFLNPNRVIQE